MSKVKEKKADLPAKTQQATSTEKNNTAKMKRKNWMKQKFKKKKPPPKKEEEKSKPQHMLPPQDAQQFSANWKALQEVCHQLFFLISLTLFLQNVSLQSFKTVLNFLQILKVSQPEKKQTATPNQNGTVQKKGAKDNSSKNTPENSSLKTTSKNNSLKNTPKNNSLKNTPKNNGLPTEKDKGKEGNEGKHKPVPGNSVSKDPVVTSKVPASSETGQSAAPKRKTDSGELNSQLAAKKKKKKEKAVAVVENTKPTE